MSRRAVRGIARFWLVAVFGAVLVLWPVAPVPHAHAQDARPVPLGGRGNIVGSRAPTASTQPGGAALCRGATCPGDSLMPGSANFLRDSYANGALAHSGTLASIQGPEGSSGTGDAYTPKYGSVARSVMYSSGCTYGASGTQDVSGCNPYYNTNPAGGGNGYNYMVEVAKPDYRTTRVVSITVYDAALNVVGSTISGSRGAGDTIVASSTNSPLDPFAAANMPWSNGNVKKKAEFKTVYSLYPATTSLTDPPPTLVYAQKTLSNLDLVLRQNSDSVDSVRIGCSLDGLNISDTIPPAASNFAIDSPFIDPTTDLSQHPELQFQTGQWTINGSLPIIAQGDNGGRWGDQNGNGCLSNWTNGQPTAGSLVAFRDLYNRQVLDIVPYSGAATSTWGNQTCRSASAPTAPPCVQLKLVTSSYLPYSGAPMVYHDMRVAGKQYVNYKHTGNVWHGYQPAGERCCEPLLTYSMREIAGAGDNDQPFDAPSAYVRLNVNVLNALDHDARTGSGINNYAVVATYLDCPTPTAAYATCTPVTDAAPQVYAVGAFSAVVSGGTGDTDVDLARITLDHAGGLADVALFDIGDFAADVDIQLLDPLGHPLTFDATCRYAPPGLNATLTTCPYPAQPNQFAVTSVAVSRTTYTRQYDSEWLYLDVRLPDAATFASYPGVDPTRPQSAENRCDCHFQLRYRVSGSGQWSDSTTWQVTLTDSAPPVVSVSPTTLTFDYLHGATELLSDQSVALDFTPAAPDAAWTATVATATGGAWLTLTPTSGTGAASLTVHVAPGNLAPAMYSGTITISAPGTTGSPVSIPVTLNVTPKPATLALSTTLEGCRRNGQPTACVPGDVLQVSATLANTGDVAATHLVLAAILPDDLILVPGSIQAAAPLTPGTRLAALATADTLAGGAQATVTFAARIAPTYSNTTETVRIATHVATDTGLVADAQADVRVAQPGAAAPTGRITLGLGATPDQVLGVGQALDLPLRITNTTGAAQANVTVRVALPGALKAAPQMISVSGGGAIVRSRSLRTVIIGIADLPVGETRVLVHIGVTNTQPTPTLLIFRARLTARGYAAQSNIVHLTRGATSRDTGVAGSVQALVVGQTGQVARVTGAVFAPGEPLTAYLVAPDGTFSPLPVGAKGLRANGRGAVRLTVDLSTRAAGSYRVVVVGTYSHIVGVTNVSVAG